MNPQPSPIVGDIVAWIVGFVFAFYAYKSYIEGKSMSIHDLDNFVLGYVQDPHTVEKHYHNTYNSIQNVTNKPSFESQQLYLDCIDALHALGMKKNEAKKKAKFIFSTMNPPPSTIQEFLIIALNMPK